MCTFALLCFYYKHKYSHRTVQATCAAGVRDNSAAARRFEWILRSALNHQVKNITFIFRWHFRCLSSMMFIVACSSNVAGKLITQSILHSALVGCQLCCISNRRIFLFIYSRLKEFQGGTGICMFIIGDSINDNYILCNIRHDNLSQLICNLFVLTDQIPMRQAILLHFQSICNLAYVDYASAYVDVWILDCICLKQNIP